MGIFNTKFFTDENGVEKKTDIYDNGMTITQKANPPEEVTPSLSQLDHIEAATEYLMAMQE